MSGVILGVLVSGSSLGPALILDLFAPLLLLVVLDVQPNNGRIGQHMLSSCFLILRMIFLSYLVRPSIGTFVRSSSK